MFTLIYSFFDPLFPEQDFMIHKVVYLTQMHQVVWNILLNEKCPVLVPKYQESWTLQNANDVTIPLIHLQQLLLFSVMSLFMSWLSPLYWLEFEGWIKEVLNCIKLEKIRLC